MGIEFKRLDERYVKDASECIARAFATNDVLSIALKIGLEDWRTFARQETTRSVEDGISLVALDDGKLVGANLVYDSSRYSPENYETLDSFTPISGLMKKLHEGYQIPPRTAHASYLGIMPKYTNGKDNRISHNIMRKNTEIIKNRGYKNIIAEVTSPYIQFATKIMGFKKINEIFYKDFTYEGEKIFQRIKNAKSCMLMELKL